MWTPGTNPRPQSFTASTLMNDSFSQPPIFLLLYGGSVCLSVHRGQRLMLVNSRSLSLYVLRRGSLTGLEVINSAWRAMQWTPSVSTLSHTPVSADLLATYLFFSCVLRPKPRSLCMDLQVKPSSRSCISLFLCSISEIVFIAKVLIYFNPEQVWKLVGKSIHFFKNIKVLHTTHYFLKLTKFWSYHCFFPS